MKRQFTPADRLEIWAKFNGVDLLNTQVRGTEHKGTGLFAKSKDRLNGPATLLVVPKDLVLSLTAVEEFAKADRHLRDVLDAIGDFGRTARGAILIFLILQITHSSPDAGEAIGVSNPLTEYVKFLPEKVSLPTSWSEEEREILYGTSLAAATENKLRSLDSEYDLLREKTKDIPWCNSVWWDEDTGNLTIDDWKAVDAMYRSRALELPGTGHVMVPCIDMANHASGDETIALYETDEDGNAVLQLAAGKSLDHGQEITITYGDKKGACEMVYSYGFLEDSQQSARELFLDLDIPNDDPLKRAKRSASKDAPGLRIYQEEHEVKWESPFVWWSCVNQENGLNFSVVQDNDGNRNLTASWKGHELDPLMLTDTLKDDAMWDIYQLRAAVILEARVIEQLQKLDAAAEVLSATLQTQDIDSDIQRMVRRLQVCEASLLRQANQAMAERKMQLVESSTVQQYLKNELTTNDVPSSDEDFS